MFYSHEILTSREAGIATVWLVATLGSNAKHRRLTRKSILEVDVPRACNIIVDSETPMALRLQGNLLYGVTRVLSRKWEYVLSDAQTVQSNMKMLLKPSPTSALDSNAGKATPDQLMILDDPAFSLDAALPGLEIDLYALGITSDESSRRSSIFSASSHGSPLSSKPGSDQSMVDLIIPSSDMEAGQQLGGVQSQDESVSLAIRRAPLESMIIDDDPNFDPGFSFDVDGNVIEDAPPAGDSHLPVHSSVGSDPQGGMRASQVPMEGLPTREGQIDTDIPDDLQILDVDNNILPSAESFPISRPGDVAPQSQHASSPENEVEPAPTAVATAPLTQRQRALRALPIDQVQELSSHVLATWRDNYLANMADAREAKKRKTALFVARKDAGRWSLELGFGEIGAVLGRAELRNPLNILLAGSAGLDMPQNLQRSSMGRKRMRDETDEDDGDQRVLHGEELNEEVGRGEDTMLQDENGMMPLDSEDIEVGRRAPASLEDRSFPWNMTASLQGSRQSSVMRGRIHSSSAGGLPNSRGPPGSIRGISAPRHSSIDRRVSRLTSASPLTGRGRPQYSSLEFSAGDDFNLHSADSGPVEAHAYEEFELFGPGAAVDTQTAAQSQWMHAALTQEAGNFLSFVKNEIDSLQPRIPENDSDGNEPAAPSDARTSIKLDQLLPPTQHTKIVGAQALLHVLSLATAGQLCVNQEEAFGSIDLSLPV